ncbi:MAG: YndJ family transporter, partial [Acidobacteriota bacterium]
MENEETHFVRRSRTNALASGIVWLLMLLPLSVWFSFPVETGGETWLIERLLMLAILVFTPLALSLTTARKEDGTHVWPYRAAIVFQPFAAMLVVVSFYSRTGLTAAAMTGGWVLLTGLVALFGLWRLWRRWELRASILPMEELCIDAGLAYVVVGSGWLL